MNRVTANELKTKGVGVLEDETLISVRGRDEYVVLDMEHYNRIREMELDLAIYESSEDIRNGKTVSESVEEHIRRLKDAI